MHNIEMRQDRAKIVREMVELSQANDATSQNRWRELDAQQESLRVQIEQSERASALNVEMNSIPNAERPNVGEEHQQPLGPNHLVRSTPGYKREFDAWLRTGERGPELRAVGVGGDGSTLVPIGFEQELETKMKYWGGLANICRTLTTSQGNPLHYPTLDDSSNVGEWLAEAAGVGSADPTFSEVVFGANLLSSKQVKVSVQLEQDSAFDMIARCCPTHSGNGLDRALDTALWTGDGSTIPITGLLTALQAAGGRSVLAVGANANSGNSGDTDLNTIGTR